MLCTSQTTHTLQPVEVSSSKYASDSLIKVVQPQSDLSLWLLSHKGVTLRNYGPAASSAIRLRGGSSGQTATFWHGISIQNPMLGMTDASALPLFLFDRLAIHYNASNVLQSSTSGFSSLNLDEEDGAKPLQSTRILVSENSLKNSSFGFKTQYNWGSVYAQSKAYVQRHLNEYLWMPVSNISSYLIHAAESQTHFIQDFKVELSNKHRIEFHIWSQQLMRQSSYEIAQALNRSGSKQSALHAIGSWNAKYAHLSARAAVSFRADRFSYQDTLTGLHSLQTLQEWQSQIQFQTKEYKFLNIKGGFNSYWVQAMATSYLQKNTLHQPNAWCSNQTRIKWIELQTTLRLELLDKISNPLSWMQQIKLLKNNFSSRFTAGRQIRWPSLNERFWQPGGNLFLNPEENLGFDAEVAWYAYNHRNAIQITQTAYVKQINNWIAWLPGASGLPRVVNIPLVHNRGVETELVVSSRWPNAIKTRFTMHITCAYTFTLAEAQWKVWNLNGYQWIYTPLYSGFAQMRVEYKQLSIQIGNHYVGYTYTSSDHHSWLNPFWIQNASMEIKWPLFKRQEFIAQIFADNLSDQSYQWIVGKPMPGRTLGISFQYAF